MMNKFSKGQWVFYLLSMGIAFLMGGILLIRDISKGPMSEIEKGRHTGSGVALRRLETEEESGVDESGHDEAGELCVINEMLANGNKYDRIFLFEQMLRSTDNSAIPGIVHLLKASPAGDPRDQLFFIVFRYWGMVDPERAVDYFDGASIQTLNLHLGNVLDGWSSLDPFAAWMWVEEQNDPVILDRALSINGGVLSSMARTAPETAFEVALRLPNELQMRALIGIAGALQSADQVVKLSDRVLDLPSGNMKSNVIRNLSRKFGTFDPESGATWIEKLDRKEERKLATRFLAGGWARHAPLEAADWAMTLDAGLRKEALDSVMWRWGDLNEAASDYINSTESDSLREELVYSLLDHIESVASGHMRETGWSLVVLSENLELNGVLSILQGIASEELHDVYIGKETTRISITTKAARQLITISDAGGDGA